jgi:hypothetical protein
MAVKAANDAVDENGISPTYAVFGAHARPIPALSKTLVPTTDNRNQSIDCARRAIERQKAAEAVERARTATGPFPAENRFATGDKVLTYRKDAWTGPHTVYETLGDTDVIILDGNTRKKVTLETSQVKLYIPPGTEEKNFLAAHCASIALADTVSDIKADTAEVPLEANPEPVPATCKYSSSLRHL